MAASRKCVSQPFHCVAHVPVNIGTFNLGLDQHQRESLNFEIQRIVAKAFEEGDLDLLNLCEVGGHKQGLPACRCDTSSITDGALTQGEYGSCATQAYMSVWHETGVFQPGGVSLKPVHYDSPSQQQSEVFALTTSVALQPQLVLTTYAVTANASAGDGMLFVGQLHLRTPHGTKSPSNETRKRVVREALDIMTRAANSCVFQPAVAVLCGDVNLNQDNADACCQTEKGDPDVRTHWHTQTSSEALSGDVAFVRGCSSQAFDVTIGASYRDRGIRNDCHDFVGVTVSVPLFHIPEAPRQKKLRFEGGVEVKASPETLQPKPVSEDVASASASVSHPGVDASSATALSSQPNRSAGPRNALTYCVGENIVKDMKAWYAERVDDENVAKTWKHLHNVLFKKVRVPYKADIWCQAEEGTPMVVSEEFVASQVKKVIERREQWLRNKRLPLQTVMNNSQKDAFLAEVKAEYHASENQKRRQQADAAAGKSLQTGKKQRWSRECQRLGGTTQMFHLLSFSGRWDAAFFETAPLPQQVGQQAEEQKKATRAAVNARAKLRLAKNYEFLGKNRRLYADHQDLLAKLRDGTLEAEAKRLTLLSGHGNFQRSDGTSLNIGGSTGGFTRAVLYDWAPPTLDQEFQ